MPNSTCHLSGIVRIIYPGPYLPFKWYRACYLLGQYLQFLRYRAHSVYRRVPAIFAVPCLLFIWHGTCNFCGTVPIIYTGRYLQFWRYHACYLYGTVPAIFAVPCLLFIRDGTCNFGGTMPVIYMARYLPFLRYRACYLYGTVPAMKRYCACYLLGQYLQFLRYRAHSVYGMVIRCE